jgi:phosphinothricin acetyltransferase
VKSAIRRAEPADAEAIARIYAPFVSQKATSFEAVPPNAAEMERRLTAARGKYPWIVFNTDGDVLGYAYASSHHERQAYQWSVNVSVYVDPHAHRAGVGRALYSALFYILRRQRFANAYGGITLPNPSSEGLHASMGFVPVGIYKQVGFKLGQWHDVLWTHLRLSDARAPMGDPLPVADLFRDDAVLAHLAAYADAVRVKSVQQHSSKSPRSRHI